MKGEPQFAVAQLEKAIKVNPHDYKAMNTLGVTQDMLGQQAAAQAGYRRILKEDPENLVGQEQSRPFPGALRQYRRVDQIAGGNRRFHDAQRPSASKTWLSSMPPPAAPKMR